MLRAAILSLYASTATAYKLPATEVLSRRAAVASGLATFTALPAFAAPTALQPCPKGANNCYSSASTGKNQVASWVWPASSSRDAAIKELSAVIDSYPQEGQSGVDLGGWTFADDDIKTSGYARLEFKSGIGNFAKFFNGAKPFIDDLEVNVEASSVCVRSSSRVGDSDFGVNAKRLNWIADKLRAKGWTAPSVQALG